MKAKLFILIAIAICCIIVSLTSCDPAKHLSRFLGRHPELVKVDSVFIQDTVITKQIQKDTTFWFNQPDTVFITKDKLQIKYFFNHQDSTVYLDGKVKPDTIIKTRLQYIYKVEPKPDLSRWQKFKIWIGEKALWLLLILLLIGLWKCFKNVIVLWFPWLKFLIR